ncbi:MAG: hypothetical protein ACLFPI_08610 [Desulfobacterales bacterium]
MIGFPPKVQIVLAKTTSIKLIIFADKTGPDNNSLGGPKVIFYSGGVMGKEGDAGFCILDTETRAISRITFE